MRPEPGPGNDWPGLFASRPRPAAADTIGLAREPRTSREVDVIAKATITQTFDTSGNCLTLSMSVDYDAIDSPEALGECVKNAVVLWHVTDDQEMP